MPPQAFYLIPVPSGPPDRPDQGLPGSGIGGPGGPGEPGGGPPPWGIEVPVDPSYGRPEWPCRPDNSLPWGGRPDNSLPPAPAHPWLPGWLAHYLNGPHPSHPWVPPWFNQGPVDPGWGIPVGPGIGVKHPLLWLLPWLIKPAAPQSVIQPAPPGDAPDPAKTYTKVLVAVAPGVFKWGWVAIEPPPVPPTAA